MTIDQELESWRRHWHAQPSVPMDLFRKVERETTDMRRYRIAEVLVTVFMGGGSLVLAFFNPTANWILLASGTWLFIVLAWIFSLRSTRGIWAAGAPTTAAYLDLSIRRCRWKMRDARYDTIQGTLLTAFVLVIDYRLIAERGDAPSLAFFLALFVVIGGAIAVSFERKRRKAAAELVDLTKLQRELEDAR